MKMFNLILVFSLLLPMPALARSEVFTLRENISNTQEFYAGGVPGAVMMKVNVLGAVNRPGVYNIPLNTEIPQLIAFAGGTTSEARLTEVTIRSKVGNSHQINKFDLDNYFDKDSLTLGHLRPDDYVFVPHDKSLLSPEVLKVSYFVSLLLGIAVSALLIDRTSEK